MRPSQSGELHSTAELTGLCDRRRYGGGDEGPDAGDRRQIPCSSAGARRGQAHALDFGGSARRIRDAQLWRAPRSRRSLPAGKTLVSGRGLHAPFHSASRSGTFGPFPRRTPENTGAAIASATASGTATRRSSMRFATPGTPRWHATALTLEAQCATTSRHMKVRSRAVSSAGRASRLHREGRRFESVTAHQCVAAAMAGVLMRLPPGRTGARRRALLALRLTWPRAYPIRQVSCAAIATPRRGGVAQLVRAPACHAGGRGFKSRLSRHCLWQRAVSG
jgi:hypothetical protein